jgi:hypothetical protein
VLAESDPELAAVAAETDAERLGYVTTFVEYVAAAGWLRPALTVAEAADSCWALTSPQVFDRLRRVRGWSGEAYRSWLEQMLAAALLPGRLPD